MDFLSTLRTGDPEKVAEYLDAPVWRPDQEEIKAILSNLCRRMAELEKRGREIQASVAERRGG